MPSQKIQFHVSSPVFDRLETHGGPLRLSANQYARLLLLLALDKFSPSDVRRMKVEDADRRRKARRTQALEQSERYDA